MGWLSAIGQGGGQAVDRYSQWRQLDQENQWKEAERQRQAGLDAENSREAAIRLKALQRSLTKNELEDAIAPLSPGAIADEATFAKAAAAGGGHLFDPTTRAFRGTWDQQQTLAKNKREEEQYGFEKQQNELKLAEYQRQLAGQKQLAEWMQQNPNAGPQDIIKAVGSFGVTSLPPGVAELLDYKTRIQTAGITSQAQIEAARLKAKLDEDALTKQHALQLGQDYKTMPKSINELYAERAAEYIKNTKEQPGPELKAQVIMEWAGLQRRLAETQRGLKMPVTVSEAPGGSPFYQQQLQAIPSIAMQIASGSLKPDVAMAEIHNDGAEGRLTGPEMQALRNQLRGYLSPLGFDMPFYNGNEQQAAPGGGPVAVSPDQMMPQVRFGGGMPSRSSGLTASHAPSPLLNAIVPSHSRR